MVVYKNSEADLKISFGSAHLILKRIAMSVKKRTLLRRKVPGP